MLSQKNILILTSRTGGGHLSLAEALRDLIEEDIHAESPETALRPHTSITLADPQPDIFESHYRLVSRHALSVWAWEFQFLNTPQRALGAHRVFARVVRRQLHALLDKV